MQYPYHLTADQQLHRAVYVGVLKMAGPIENFSTWLLTGVAAILALFVTNLEPINNVISDFGVRWGLSLLTISMIAGVVAKPLGIAVRSGVELTDGMYADMETPEWAEMAKNLKGDAATYVKDISEPFLWPLDRIMASAARKASTDGLRGEKLFIKMYCVQVYALYTQAGLAAAGLLFLVLFIK